jgi:hypothetical protein
MVATQIQPRPPQNAIAYFIDVAQKAGLTAPIVFGGKDTKSTSLKLPARARLRLRQRRWSDIFLVNGTTQEGFPLAAQPIIFIATTTTAPSPT